METGYNLLCLKRAITEHLKCGVTEGRILNRTLINLNSRTWLRYWTAQGQAAETAKTKRGKKELVGAEAGCSTRLGSAAARAARRLRASDAGTCRGPRGRPSVHTLGSGTAEPRATPGTVQTARPG